MGFLISEEQRKELEAAGTSALPATIMAILRSNHARVLDWFRSMDTNFDGCISQGEMSFALHALGLNASPKEISQLFQVLDPDGNGVVEFEELRAALTDPSKWNKPPPPKKLTSKQKAQLRNDNVWHRAEVIEELFAFERSRGLDDPSAKQPPTADEAMLSERRRQRQAHAWKVREGKVSATPVTVPAMYQLDSCWRKSQLVRPQTAPARVHAAASTARRKAANYDYWVSKHRGEVEAHALAVEMQYIEEARMRKQRCSAARNAQLTFYRTKAAAANDRAVERGELFPSRRQMERSRQAVIDRTRERAWGQDIVFLPPAVARREPSVIRGRMSPDYAEGRQAVHALGAY